MKSSSDYRPEAVEAIGNGSFFYNYNITERTIEEGGETRIVYDYDQIIVWDSPDYDKIVKAVIREEYDETQEFELVNGYNSFKEGITEDENERNKYIAFLQFVSGVKVMVKRDLGIE